MKYKKQSPVRALAQLLSEMWYGIVLFSFVGVWVAYRDDAQYMAVLVCKLFAAHLFAAIVLVSLRLQRKLAWRAVSLSLTTAIVVAVQMRISPVLVWLKIEEWYSQLTEVAQMQLALVGVFLGSLWILSRHGVDRMPKVSRGSTDKNESVMEPFFDNSQLYGSNVFGHFPSRDE